ncbi:MAG: carbohydrate ABC transporter permease [Thermomicrobiales bacterium]
MARTAVATRTRRRVRPAGWRGSPIKKTRYGLIFASPALIFFSVFYIFPLGWAVWISFNEWSLLGSPEYIGLDNYRNLLNDSEFINAIKVTFVYVFGTVIPIWILALGLALVFNRPFRFRQFYISAYYIPAVISLFVWCLLWVLVYQPSWGLMTLASEPLGFGYVRWLNDRNLAMPALILLSIIKGTPAYMIIYLAGLRGIPTDYYEAASLDGANSFQKFRDVTLPLLRPVMLYVAVISIIVAFQVFTPAYVLTSGGPGNATRVLPMFIFENAFEFLKMGYASAASMLLLLMLLGLTLIQFRLLGARPE